jgi:putative flavoprotein involved in K+ transport
MTLNGPEGEYDVLVIGGGPAGLSLGYELKRRSVSFAILERGDAVGDSWANMPANLRLVSPWRASSLPGSPANLFPRHHEVSRHEFHRYLNDYARQHALPVRTNISASAVSRDADGGFQIDTARGVFRSRLLVNATGHFGKPFVPPVPGAKESSIPQIHDAEYREPQQLKQRFSGGTRPVLIVGKRLSASQTLVELADAGLPVALSHRSPIQFGPGPAGLWIFLRILPELEALKLAVLGGRAHDWDVKMPGGRAKRLIRSGAVKTYPRIRLFEQEQVVFENGETLAPSVVIYATGFQPALDHLRALLPELNSGQTMPARNGMESVAAPGLFFLGLAGLRNSQSRYLRGIRRDAIVLAEQLHARLQSIPRTAPSRSALALRSSVTVP